MRPLLARLALAIPLAASALLASAGCQTTTVTTTWQSPEPMPTEPFQRVLALVVNASPAERRAGEDALVEAIKRARATASYTLISDEELTDREKVKAILIREQIDGAAVIRLVAVDRESTYYPPTPSDTYQPAYGFTGPSNFYGFSSYPTYRPGHTVTDTIYRAEVSIYSVPEDRLLWAGSSTTANPSSIDDLVRQVAQGTGDELRRRGLLR